MTKRSEEAVSITKIGKLLTGGSANYSDDSSVILCHHFHKRVFTTMVQKDLSGLELTTYIWDIVSDNLVPIGCELSVFVCVGLRN